MMISENMMDYPMSFPLAVHLEFILVIILNWVGLGWG